MKKSVKITLIIAAVVLMLAGVAFFLLVAVAKNKGDDLPDEHGSENIREVLNVVKLYYASCGDYPAVDRWPEVLEEPLPPGCNQSTPLDDKISYQDKWGRLLHYYVDPAEGEAYIYTFGQDGKPGGDGADADYSKPTMSAAQWQIVSP